MPNVHKISRVKVQPIMLRWARERARLSDASIPESGSVVNLKATSLNRDRGFKADAVVALYDSREAKFDRS